MQQDSILKQLTIKREFTSALERPTSVRFTNRSNSTDSQVAAISIYSQLQAKLSEFEELSFPTLVLPTSRNKNKSKKKPKPKIVEKIAKKEVANIALPLFQSTDEGHMYALSATATFDTNRSSLGPGRYELPDDKNILGGFVSSMPRFGSSTLELAEKYFHEKEKRESQKIKVIKDPNLERFTKDHRLRAIEGASKIREFEEGIHKRTKLMLDQINKEKRLQKYNEKMSQFEWRMKRDQIRELKRSWGCISSIIGFASIVKLRIEAKIYRVERVRHVYGCLYWCSRAIGKFIRVLRKFRWLNLIKIVAKHRIHIRKWLDKRKVLFSRMVNIILDNAFMGNYMTQIMREFKNHIVYAQKSVKSFIRIKKARFWGLSLLFKKIEKQLYAKTGGGVGIRRNSAESIISPVIIEQEIRNYLKKKSKEHSKKMKIYRENMIIYKQGLEKQEDDVIFVKHVEILTPPKRPSFLIYTRVQEFINHFRPSMPTELKTKTQEIRRFSTRPPEARRQSKLFNP